MGGPRSSVPIRGCPMSGGVQFRAHPGTHPLSSLVGWRIRPQCGSWFLSFFSISQGLLPRIVLNRCPDSQVPLFHLSTP